MLLPDLPNELLALIGHYLLAESLCALTLTCRHLFLVYQPELVRSNAKALAWGWTPLSLAARHGHDAIVELLLSDPREDPDQRDEEGETALFWAARCGQAPILRRLLATNRVNPTRQNHRHQTPLYGAASRGQPLTTRLLLDTPGIEPNPSNESGRTPLWIAAAQGHVSTVECLLAVPAIDINRSDDSGSSPFLAAASYGREEVMAVLAKEIQVDLRARDNHGRTALARAAGKGHIRVVRQLLNMDQFDLGSRDFEGWTPLACAAWYGHTAVVSFLADLEGVDINSRDHLGRTPLFLAVRNGRYEVVNYLCNRADVEQDVTDSTGKTLRMAAQDNEDRIMLALLGSFGLRIDEPLPLTLKDVLHIVGFVIALIAMLAGIRSGRSALPQRSYCGVILVMIVHLGANLISSSFNASFPVCFSWRFVPWERFLSESLGDINDIWTRQKAALSRRLLFAPDNIQLLKRSAEDAKRDAKQWAACSGDDGCNSGVAEAGDGGGDGAGGRDEADVQTTYCCGSAGDTTRLIDVLRSAGGANQITAGSSELLAMTQKLCPFQHAALGSTAELRARIASKPEARTVALPGGLFTGSEVPAQRLLRSIKSQQTNASREMERMIQGIQGIQGLTDHNTAGRDASVNAVLSGFGEQDVQLSVADVEESMPNRGPAASVQLGPSTSFLAAGRQLAERFTLNHKQSVAFLLLCQQLDLIRGGESTHGQPAPQLYQFIGGEGGTGKSRVIEAPVELFAGKGVSHRLTSAI
ncbi:unnamed protein product [Clonostachys rhizophaga]|uniref:Uncharacterized protein n=1 Tax=Clonostachys rhizophaga TaxID=160324 RepID=A0A9N9VA53_9HYPO|nr:unnamed protein product [Clonostachys rhizophaga]